MLRLSEVGIQDAHATDEHRHLGRGQRHELRPIEEQFLCRYRVFGLEVVAEPVRHRLEHGKRLHIGLLLRCIRAARREGHLYVVPGVLRGLLDSCAATQDDGVGEGDPLRARLCFVELLLDGLEGLEHLRQLDRLVDLPVILRRQADARAVGSAALVGAAERGSRRPGGGDQFGDGQPRSQKLALEFGNVLGVDQFMVDCRGAILPQQLLSRYQRAEMARAGAHVAVRQLEPRPSKRISELIRVLVETPRNRRIDGVHPQGEVRRGHDGCMPLRRIVGIRYDLRCCRIRRHPLPGSGGALHQIPIVGEQSVEIAVVPRHRCRGPGPFDAASDRVDALTAAEAVLPTEALLFDAGSLGFGANERRITGAMTLAERVSAGDECDGLFVVHRHAREGLPDVLARGHCTRLAVRTFRVHIDQAHLNGGQRVLEVPVAAVALVAEPLRLSSPVDVCLGLPDVLAPAGETEGL